MTCFSLAIRMLLHMTLGGKAINPKKKNSNAHETRWLVPKI